MLYPDDERAVTNQDCSDTTATVVAWEQDGELGISVLCTSFTDMLILKKKIYHISVISLLVF
jgi:hypothetical protein